MLAALLTNIPHGQSGHLFGSVGPNPTFRGTGTGWNKNWATDYGPDVDRARKAKKKEVQTAIKALKAAPDLEPIEGAQEIAKRSLASELMKDDESLVSVMTAYYALRRWKKKQNDIAAILLLS